MDTVTTVASNLYFLVMNLYFTIILYQIKL